MHEFPAAIPPSLGPAVRQDWLASLAASPVTVVACLGVAGDESGWRALAEAALRSRPDPIRRAHALCLAEVGLGAAQALGVRRVGLYSPVGAEVDTRELANRLLAHGFLLAYPRLRPAGDALDPAACDGPTFLAPRPRTRLLEPTGPVLDPRELDLVFVHALLVRTDLARLGRPDDLQDAYLAGLRPECVVVGVTAAACVLDWTPRSPSDRRVTAVCTEHGLFGPAAQKATA
jgi:5-formyltetrahydrofolate cyclo-ligase